MSDARSPSALYPSHVRTASAEKTTGILDALMVLAWLDFWVLNTRHVEEIILLPGQVVSN
ncbi:hypothetical protein DEU56DRAFT_907789 [Suillus clintonianus]|uniref:uncharacterized protein n=1 Tax=Suillus clintonianus TaxID=1904413 RepID=UPI001B871C19|nr:uncharacterized protein DEU56DRAFT_907789 [Suillus clintonianus]KAG2153359.1 hypothetical protein DEU56DRAFT_907789 [Suillus clintonianus]